METDKRSFLNSSISLLVRVLQVVIHKYRSESWVFTKGSVLDQESSNSAGHRHQSHVYTRETSWEFSKEMLELHIQQQQKGYREGKWRQAWRCGFLFLLTNVLMSPPTPLHAFVLTFAIDISLLK